VKLLRVEFAAEALDALNSIAIWWRKNREGSPLFEGELTAATRLLAAFPHAGAPADWVEMGVRHLLLRRTQYYLYYRVNQTDGVVEILAVRHTARGSGPGL
jgi:plasmid stabilization system protein ParE